jgi:hypothetical protein
MGRQADQGSLSPAARPKGYLIVSICHARFQKAVFLFLCTV